MHTSFSFCHKNQLNLTVIYLSERTLFYGDPEGSRVNVTFAENTPPWEYAGRIEYLMDIEAEVIPFEITEGQIGWLMWD